ncbi:MAG: sulfatase-like hydrolase/transferase [Verrucomicrobiota bacterium]|jgi:arylsulfatase A-like enzyme|nr:sulfatase-like hydrolase/transferase [Verrucomicrobiota bacterium]MDP6795209.1 sulfatase-like hydrolase/transferase [Verrucomicrobiota bacterium]
MAWQPVKAASPKPIRSGFEQASPGELRELTTSAGTWRAQPGHAEVTAQFQFTGKQCLHIFGGKERQIQFTPASRVKTPGKLTFQAERWTERQPFQFRIEERVNGKWAELFNGDRAVVVGRAFKSRVSIPLTRNPERLRFTCTSPERSGILIDDVALVPATPQKITGVSVEGVQVPVLRGQEINPLLLVRVEVSGMLKPLQFTGAEAHLSGTITDADLEGAEWFTSGNSPNLSAAKRVAAAVRGPNGRYVFQGKHSLVEGTNHLWLSVKLSKQANIDRTIRAACSFVKFSDGKIHKSQAANSVVHRLGMALRLGGQGGVHTSRIPGLATTPKGTLIAVYDLRHRGGGDLPGDIDVGMSRSTDGGQTWEPTRTIMDMGSDPKWRYDGIGDPAVLVDRNTGTIWVAATWSHGNRSWIGSGPGMKPEETGQFMLVRSDDDGKTWFKPINITSQVKKPEWCFILAGPGKGITMADGTLVFAAQYQDPPNKRRLPHSTIIYSKDHGKTWTVGAGAYNDTTEAQVVEIEPGVLMLNCRYNRQNARVVMVTRDMGKTWQPHPTHGKALIEPRACMASLIGIASERTGKPGPRLLFSNPNSTASRKRMTIKASPDRGLTWPEGSQLLLDAWGSAGYSCMSMIDDETVGILYEGSRAHMTFQRVKLADVGVKVVPKKHSSKPPNVLLIVSEDNGPELGCYGDPYARTPHLDRLANEGVRFETAWVPNSVCSPSRACFLTGRYPHRNGQLGLATHKFAMFKKWPNLFSLLKTAGYRTALLGKIHVKPESAFPLDRHWNPPSSISFAKRDVRRIAAEAGKFMRAGDAPFVMSVNYPDAHYPLHRQLNGLPTFPQTAADVKTLPWIGADTERLRGHVADYYNCLARLDTGIGLLLEELVNSGKAEDTLVIYLGDHGAQFSRGKTSVYEAGLRVPMIVRWPGHANAGHVATELVSSLDILPTVLQATNVKPPAGLDGRPLQPLLEGRFVKWREHLFAHKLGSAAHFYYPQAAIRDTRYKLISNPLRRPNPLAKIYADNAGVFFIAGTRPQEVGAASPQVKAAYATYHNPPPVELYDLHADPNEFTNLADDPKHAATRERLAKRLRQWQRDTGDLMADPKALARYTKEIDEANAMKPHLVYRRDKNFRWRYLDWLQPKP